MPQHKSFQGLLLTDLDGTIKPGLGRPFAGEDLAALKTLGEKGWFRVVATGRSLFSFVKAWEPGLELDALIYSSGAATCFWDKFGPGEILSASTFDQAQAQSGIQAALALGRGFYAYLAPPDSHHFYYHRTEKVPIGFQLRLNSFQQQSWPWPGFKQGIFPEPISQILIMAPLEEADQVEREFNNLAPGLSVIRSSSPFGDGHIWLEIFPPGISKGRAAAALARHLGLGPEAAIAFGNDFNDRDLLKWAGQAFVTEDAPPEMVRTYPTIAPAGQGGLARALKGILGEKL